MDLARYRSLFVHRCDVFARQTSYGAYIPVRRQITDEDLRAHLAGDRSFGVYVIRPDWDALELDGTRPGIPDTVRYCVFDLDTYDKGALEFLCTQVERLVGPLALAFDRSSTHRQCLLLEDSGGKGYHIWLFFDRPVAARKARAWAEQVRTAYDRERRLFSRFAENRAPDWPALEIFPKQDTVEGGGYGNLVKLPFGRHAKTGARSQLYPRRDWAGTLDDVRPYPVALLPEPPAPVQRKHEATGVTRFGCVNRILAGDVDTGNRDAAMLHLAHYARGCGLPEWAAEAWCQSVNDETPEPLAGRQVLKCVASAYRMAAPHPSCAQDWLRDFCPGSAVMRQCPNYEGDATSSRTLEWS